MEPARILYPDSLFADEAAVERVVAGQRAALQFYSESDPARIPDTVWRRAQGLVTGLTMPIDERVMRRLDSCRIITRMGVGYDLIDTAAAARRGIAVCNVPDYGTNEVADHAIALLLGFTRGIVRYNDSVRSDAATGWDYLKAPSVVRLAGKTLGIIGLGRIGTATALRAKAFGLSVQAYDPYLPDGQELALGVQRIAGLKPLLGGVDFLSIHCPLTPETRGLIDGEAVAAMKKGLVLINTARGPICDLKALHAGLRSGQLGAVGLDVLPSEPPPADHPLIKAWRDGAEWLAGRLIITPHAAFYSPAGMKFLREKALLTVVDYLSTGVLRNCVNRERLRVPKPARRPRPISRPAPRAVRRPRTKA